MKTQKTSVLLLICFGAMFLLIGRENYEFETRGASVEATSKNIDRTAALIRSRERQEKLKYTRRDVKPGEEDWRGAPIGDGEDTVDSYHSFDHRPSGNDPRDEVLKQYSIHRCPHNGMGTMVSGQDSRYYETNDPLYKERNPKFLCDIDKITESTHQPCVVYSFGSWDEISFEVGIDRATDTKCQVHTFDPFKLPTDEVAAKNHFHAHDTGLSGSDSGKFKRLSTIMGELGHDHIHVLKIDIEGAEEQCLPNIQEEGILAKVDQLSFEFHSVSYMKTALDILHSQGFGIVFARREDRCKECTEVTLVRVW